MPIYLLRCPACRRQEERFCRSYDASLAAACFGCGAGGLEHRVTRFAIGRTLTQIHSSAGDPRDTADPANYRDPRSIGRWTEQQAERLGVDLPAEVRGMIDAARNGDLPAGVADL